MAKRIADKNIIEGLDSAAMAAESFLKVYYKAKKELEGFNSPTPRQGRKKEIMEHVIKQQQLSRLRTINRAKQNQAS